MRSGSTRYWVYLTRSISLDVHLEGLVDKNILLESIYNIRVFLSSVFRAQTTLDGRRFHGIEGEYLKRTMWVIVFKGASGETFIL